MIKLTAHAILTSAPISGLRDMRDMIEASLAAGEYRDVAVPWMRAYLREIERHLAGRPKE